jgi:integrase
MLTFSQFAQRYVDARDLSAGYADTLKKRAAALERTAKRPYLADVLNEAVVNAFLKSLVGSPYTIAKYRQDFLCIWRAAADEDYVAYPIPRRIWRPKTPDLIVNCYTLEEVRSLVDASEKLPGGMPNGVPRRRYWPAMIRLAWDSGLRRGDLWRFNVDAVRPDGSLIVIQRKTGKAKPCFLRPKTLAAVRAVGKMDWPLCLRAFAIHFAEITRLAGVNRGVFKWLRRASGSYAEAEQAGSGHKQLGNTPQIFSTHYDARLGGVSWKLPPEL